jgi:hypothetical protein
METTRSSETSVNFYWTVWRNITDDGIVHRYRCENLKFNIFIYGLDDEDANSSDCIASNNTMIRE